MTGILHLVLAECELELVPLEISEHPQVRAHARQSNKRGTRTLLDSSYHHGALKHVDEGHRRGRPDLVHMFLLVALESRLNKAGRLRVHLHLRGDRVVTIDPTTRLVRHYPRFVGLMEQLLRNGQVPREGDPLLAVEDNVTLAELVKRLGVDQVVILDEAADVVTPRSLMEGVLAADGDACLVIGGFPHGGFTEANKTVATRTASIGTDVLPVWTVAGEVLAQAGSVWLDT